MSYATNIHVLVVDDEPTILDEIVQYLYGESIVAIPASFPAEAVRRFAGRPEISVVITDMKTPGQDDLSMARDLLATITPANAVEVIVITGHPEAPKAAGAIEPPVFEFLPKPVDLARLANSVRRAHVAAMARRQAGTRPVGTPPA